MSERLQKIIDKIPANTRKAFTQQTGIPASEIEEIQEAFPGSYFVTIHTNNRTFIGRLTYTGRIKKDSITEEK